MIIFALSVRYEYVLYILIQMHNVIRILCHEDASGRDCLRPVGGVLVVVVVCVVAGVASGRVACYRRTVVARAVGVVVAGGSAVGAGAVGAGGSVTGAGTSRMDTNA